MLRSQGLQMNQQVEFLSDGGEDVRNVQLYLPNSRCSSRSVLFDAHLSHSLLPRSRLRAMLMRFQRLEIGARGRVFLFLLLQMLENAFEIVIELRGVGLPDGT